MFLSRIRTFVYLFVAPLLLSAALSVWFEVNVLKSVVKKIDAYLNSEDSVVTIERSGGTIRLYRESGTGLIHIDADNEMDMLFGQGYAQARDRLFQLEILRRLSHGTLSELVGAKALKVDMWQRTMGFKGLAQQDLDLLRAVSPETGAGLTAFIEGVNAYLSKRSSSLWNMPIDLILLGCIPEPFIDRDSIVFQRWHAMAMNKGWQNELLFAVLYSELDADTTEAIRSILRYDSDHLAGGMSSTLGKLKKTSPLNEDGDIGEASVYSNNGGSNAWVISGKHTVSGKPILSNDPHLPFSQPAAWVLTRMTSPGIDTSGLSVPLVPFIIGGYNKYTANGITLGRCDVDDLFYENVTNDRAEYIDSDGAYKPITTRTEVINIKGQEPVVHVVEYTRRGPLVCKLLGYDRDCSLSSLVLQDGEVMTKAWGKPSLGCFRKLMFIRNWEDFKKSAQQVAYYQLNMVYADRDGNIGYYMTGHVPIRDYIGDKIREGWNPDHQWRGWIPFSEMPHSYNPERGYIISANQKPNPGGSIDGSDNDSHLGTIWQHGWRGKRIEELITKEISAGRKVDAEMSAVWQRDLVSIPAREFADIIKNKMAAGKLSYDSKLSNVFKIVSSWDGNMAADMAEPAIYTVFKEALIRKVLESAISMNSPHIVDEVLGVGLPQFGKLVNDLEGRHGTLMLRILNDSPELQTLLSHQDKTVNELIVESMQSAVDVLEKQFSKDIGTWSWGALHTASFVHPLGRAGFPLNLIFNVDVGPVGGDVDTVCLAAFLYQQRPVDGLPLPSPLYQQRGFAASTRMIVDFGDIDTIRLMLSPGNSGRVSSPYYDKSRHILTNKVSEGIREVLLLNSSDPGTFSLELELELKA